MIIYLYLLVEFAWRVYHNYGVASCELEQAHDAAGILLWDKQSKKARAFFAGSSLQHTTHRDSLSTSKYIFPFLS